MLSERIEFSVKMRELFLPLLKVTEENLDILERETVKQSLCELWKNSGKKPNNM